jgi:hypothetical protein
MADDQPATDSAPEPEPANPASAEAAGTDAADPGSAAAEPEPPEPAEPRAADAEPVDAEPTPTVSAESRAVDAHSADADLEAAAAAEPGAEDSAAEPELPDSGSGATDSTALAEPDPAAPGSGATGLVESEATASAESSAEDPEPEASVSSAAEPVSESDSPSPAESETDKPSTLAIAGTTPAWWAWVSKRRKPVALVAGLVVVAVVATIVTVSVTTAGPRDVVQSYMDAIHAGDVDAALEIAGEPEDDGRLAFFSADALADDWSVGAIVERHRREDEADVDVTIIAGESTQQGRFHVVKGDDGWAIEAPFVDVELQVAGVSTVELGGVEQAADGTEPGSTIPLRVFPGVYDLYPSLAKQVSFDPGVLIAAPVPSADQKLRFSVEYTLTEDGAAFANGAIARQVTECATRTTISPDGCPFSGEDERALFSFSSVRNVSWAVTRMPDAEFVPDVTGLRMVVREPGLVTLSGSGFSYESDSGEAQPFTVTCEFGVDNMAVAVTKDGLSVHGAVGRPYSAVEATHCF